ncbi:hypothetical protein WME75_06610 [Sorangium sp. So ce1014]|uniref:hypothetical protein n=1 Tax=Sorangium sp. So ce1014 TaxID=3133326 RepID=UPI003F5F5431
MPDVAMGGVSLGKATIDVCLFSPVWTGVDPASPFPGGPPSTWPSSGAWTARRSRTLPG